MNLLGLIGQIFKPAMQAIDEVHTSEEERLTRKAQLMEMQIGLVDEALAYEQTLLQEKASIIKAEANSASWIARNWRPITMLTFLVLICLDAFGVLAFRLAEQAWTLLQIGIGGYVVGRSAEKVAVPVVEALKKKES